MKYFFILKDEFTNYRREQGVNDNCVRGDIFFISNETQLKSVIQKNTVHKYRKIEPFGVGDVVTLRKTFGLIWVAGMKNLLGVKMKIASINHTSGRIHLEGQDWSFYVDSVESVEHVEK